MKLSNRLKSIYDMTPYGIAADVGADHGKLIISLVEDNKIYKGYAIENKKGPFSRLKEAIEQSFKQEKIIALFSDGIKDIPPDINILIIAGMGGDNILKILNDGIDKLKNIEYIIIDAHSSIDKVREFVCNHGFSIAEEKIIYEDLIYYQIIKFVKSDKAFYTNEDFEFGPILRQEKGNLFKDMYKKRLEKIHHIIINKQVPQERIDELQKEEERIKSQLWTQNYY